MKLHITHVTTYQYDKPAEDSVNEIRLSPFTDERQSCYHHAIVVEPAASLFGYADYFGNRVHAFAVNAPHRQLTVKTQMTVVTKPEPEAQLKAARGKRARAEDTPGTSAFVDRFAEYLLPTGYTAPTDAMEELAEGGPGLGTEDILGWLGRLSSRIKTEFVYDPAATDVRTTAADFIQQRRGVCQDFAHLMIAVCRISGIPARYVSGYHFVGDLQGGNADFEQSSHAWVEAYVSGAGWRGFDPTNDAPIGERYVKLAHGRDYRDIVPMKGIYRGSGGQTLSVTVDVRNADELI